MFKKCFAEVVGTFWLVLIGCGTAVLAGSYVGFAGVALAFGLSVVTMAYAVGRISGGHFNPAVTLGLFAAGRAKKEDVIPYIACQVIGATLAALFLYVVASSGPGVDLVKGFATNGYGIASPYGYDLLSCALIEIVLTALFIFVIGMTTGAGAQTAFAPLAIGLTLTAIHLVSIPVTNTSVNPARSTGVALIAGGMALSQLWLFWVAPLLGGVLGGVMVKAFDASKRKKK